MKFSRPFVRLLPFWIFAFCFKWSAALHYTLLPILGEQVFPLWVVGLLMGGAAFLQVIFDVPAGYLLDRFGYIRLLRVGTIFFSCGALMLLFGLHPWSIILSVFCSFVGWLFFDPGINAYILVKADKRIAGRTMALRDMTVSAGVVVGMILLPFIDHLPAQVLAIILVIPFIVGLIALSRASRDTASVHEQTKIGYQSFYIRRHFVHHVLKAMGKLNPVSTLLMLVSFSSATFYGIIWFVVPLLIARQIQSGPLDFGLVIFDASVLFTGFLIGRITDSWDRRWLVCWGLLIFAVSAALLGFHFGALFMLFGFCATTGDEMASVSLWAWLDRMDKDHAEDALVAGTLTLAQDVGWTVGPILGGFLFSAFGPTSAILAGAFLIFATWMISLPLLLISPARVRGGKSRFSERPPRWRKHKG